MSDARRAFITKAVGAMSHRMRVAVAVAAADRCIELSAGCEVDTDAVETALEIARDFALGRAVSGDEAAWAWRAVDDSQGEVYEDLYGGYLQAVNVVVHMADAVRAAEGSDEAAITALECLMAAADEVTGEGSVGEELTWISRLLEAAAGRSDAQIDAGLFAVGAGAPPRWLIRAREGVINAHEDDPPDLQELTAALAAARPAAAAARAARVAERRRATPVVPFRARDGVPAQMSVREVGRAPDSSEGKIAVSGRRYFALFQADAGDDAAPLFEPPESVAIGMSADGKTLLSWRVARLPGVSGVARGHHRWTLELYDWPSRALAAAHVVTSQAVIDWCSPAWLDVPARDDGLVAAVLHGMGEDDHRRVTIIRLSDGTFSETAE
jgi:hypothetical protein